MMSLITITGGVPNIIVAGWCLDFWCVHSYKLLSVPDWNSSHTSPWSFTLQTYYFMLASHLCPGNFAQKAGVSCLLSMQNPRTSSSLATNHKVCNLNRKWAIPPPLKNEAFLYTCSRALGNDTPVSNWTTASQRTKRRTFWLFYFHPDPQMSIT